MADAVRTESPRALRLLRRAGIGRVVMLTGDRREIATTIGDSLGVDRVIAEQSPGAKLAAIAEARSQGVTMMVGDGINDAPALAAADIGVAMGARGAAAAAESAQVVLIADRLDPLVFAVRMAQQTRAIALQSVVAGMGLSLLAMIVAAFGYLPPVAGAVLQELIDVAVILNALRVLRLQKDGPDDRLSTGEFDKLKEEHARLLPVIDRIGALANRIDSTPPPLVRQELASLNALLHDQLLPHELKDESALYPKVAGMIGGDDPIAAMSSTHREIHRLARVLERLAGTAPGEARQGAFTQELRATLYALDAILRLHFAQEDEVYHNLSA
jgi:soluble P-type ATPase